MADFSPREAALPGEAEAKPQARRGLLSRLVSLRVGAMLWRNTVVSCSVFAVGLAVLWALVQLGMDEVLAAGVGFVVSNTLHYVLGRTWIFPGTDRAISTGFALFLINAVIGLVVTLVLYKALLEFTPIHYLWARVIVSLVSGLVVFVLNAVFNFRRV